MNIPKDLIAASATPLLLAILKEGDSYGYAIIKRVKALSGHTLVWTEGMLYPVLHRLEEQSMVESYWEGTEAGRRRKYYRLTPQGLEELELQRQRWEAVNDTLVKVWREEDE